MRIFVHAPQAARRRAPAGSLAPERAAEGGGPADRSILHLQRTIGNRAVQGLLPGGERGPAPRGADTLPARLVAGDRPEEAENEALGGEPGHGEAAAQPQTAALGGNATSMSTSNLDGPEWNNNGRFKWWIRWATDGTSGWIVQKIENTYSGTRADGSAITNASLGVEPVYYEAWEVAADGTITGSLGRTGNRDRWERPDLGALGSTTAFSMTGTVYWTNTNPENSGFTSGGVRNAGSLLSSTSAPAGLSSPLLVRAAYGRWARDGTQMLPGCFTT